MFDDLLEANLRYQEGFQDTGLSGVAAKRLAVVTCIDSRIDPLSVLGLSAGDAKIIRNAGARVTDDALRSLVLATNLLGAQRICLIPHTECAMAGSTEAQMQAKVAEASGQDASGWEFLAATDQMAALREDVDRLSACELIPPGTEIGTFLLDVRTGALTAVTV